MKTILLGQAPSPSTNSADVTEKRLQDLCGLSTPQYVAAFDRTNLLRDPISIRIAETVLPLLRGRRVVLVGRVVAEAIGLRSDPLVWVKLPCRGGWFDAAYLPHGLNHWYCTPANVEAAKRFLATEAQLGLEHVKRQRTVENSKELT